MEKYQENYMNTLYNNFIAHIFSEQMFYVTLTVILVVFLKFKQTSREFCLF